MIFSGNKHKSHQTIMKLLNGKHVNKEFTAQKFGKQALYPIKQKTKRAFSNIWANRHFHQQNPSFCVCFYILNCY